MLVYPSVMSGAHREQILERVGPAGTGRANVVSVLGASVAAGELVS
jgi:hypothetical protein